MIEAILLFKNEQIFYAAPFSLKITIFYHFICLYHFLTVVKVIFTIRLVNFRMNLHTREVYSKILALVYSSIINNHVNIILYNIIIIIL